MTTDEIQQLVNEIKAQQCELDDVEVKAAHYGTPKKLYDSFSALANRTGGGVILFGVDEELQFTIVGVHDVSRLITDVTGKATDEMEPPLRLQFSVAEIDSLHVVIAEVPEVSIEQKPCFYKSAGMQRGSYLRIGDSDRQMTDYEVFGFVSNRYQQEHDRVVVTEATFDDLDHNRLESYFDMLRQSNPDAPYLHQPFEQRLKTLRIVREEHGILRPTMAGLLMFGIYPQSFEPQLVITFLHYFGTTENEATPTGARFLDNKKFEGSIPVMVETAYTYILKTMRKSTLVNGLYHQEIPEYPFMAVREALLNAVMHRDYSPYARSSYIQIRLFADRLIIESPGCLYGSVTVDTLEEQQSTRNRQIMRFAEDLHLVENRGSGINTILNEMRKATMEPPIFEDTRSAFRVTFNNRHLLEPDTLTWLNTFASQPINEHQRMALAFIRHRGRITNSDYQRLNFVDTNTASRELRSLMQAGIITKHESRRWAYYVLNETIHIENDQLSLTPQLFHKEAMVLSYIREHGEITNRACQKLFAIDSWHAAELLKKLTDKKIIKKIGTTGRSVKYCLDIDNIIT
jgi:ATP-dependent DNA helicase RecG